MVKIRKGANKAKERNIFVNIAIGALGSIAAVMILLLIIAGFTTAGKIPEGMMKICAVVCCFVSTIVGSRFAIRGAQEKKLLVGAGSGVLMFIVIFAIGRAVSSEAAVSMLTLMILLASLTGGVIGGLERRKRKKLRSR